MHVLDEGWLNASSETQKSLKTLVESFLDKAKAAETEENPFSKHDMGRLEHLKACVENPWDLDVLNPILMGKPAAIFKGQ